MAMIKCPECNHDVSEKATSCPCCGYPISALVPKKYQPHNNPDDEIPISRESTVVKDSKKHFAPVLVILIATAILVVTYFSCADTIKSLVHFYDSQSTKTMTVSSPTTARPTTTPTKKPNPSWQKVYFVNDFDEPTSDWYIRGIFYGVFSNTATTESMLTACVFVENYYSGINSPEVIGIRLLEYDDYIVNLKYKSRTDITIKVKILDDIYIDHPGDLSETEIYILDSDKLFAPILKALEAGEEIKVVIEDTQYSTSTYRFTINANGLEDIDHTWNIQ